MLPKARAGDWAVYRKRIEDLCDRKERRIYLLHDSKSTLIGTYAQSLKLKKNRPRMCKRGRPINGQERMQFLRWILSDSTEPTSVIAPVGLALANRHLQFGFKQRMRWLWTVHRNHAGWYFHFYWPCVAFPGHVLAGDMTANVSQKLGKWADRRCLAKRAASSELRLILPAGLQS
jgi:hypothetical protein